MLSNYVAMLVKGTTGWSGFGCMLVLVSLILPKSMTIFTSQLISNGFIDKSPPRYNKAEQKLFIFTFKMAYFEKLNRLMHNSPRAKSSRNTKKKDFKMKAIAKVSFELIFI